MPPAHQQGSKSALPGVTQSARDYCQHISTGCRIWVSCASEAPGAPWQASRPWCAAQCPWLGVLLAIVAPREYQGDAAGLGSAWGHSVPARSPARVRRRPHCDHRQRDPQASGSRTQLSLIRRVEHRCSRSVPPSRPRPQAGAHPAPRSSRVVRLRGQRLCPTYGLSLHRQLSASHRQDRFSSLTQHPLPRTPGLITELGIPGCRARRPQTTVLRLLEHSTLHREDFRIPTTIHDSLVTVSATTLWSNSIGASQRRSAACQRRSNVHPLPPGLVPARGSVFSRR
jgi:hypothetical protein